MSNHCIDHGAVPDNPEGGIWSNHPRSIKFLSQFYNQSGVKMYTSQLRLPFFVSKLNCTRKSQLCTCGQFCAPTMATQTKGKDEMPRMVSPHRLVLKHFGFSGSFNSWVIIIKTSEREPARALAKTLWQHEILPHCL